MAIYSVVVCTKERWEVIVEAHNEEEAEARARKMVKHGGHADQATLLRREIDFVEIPIREVELQPVKED